MIPNATLTEIALAGVAMALFVSMWVLCSLGRLESRRRRDQAGLNDLISGERMATLEAVGGLHGRMAALEESVEAMRTPVRPGALNGSTRSQAIKLLRGGQSIEAASSALNLGRKETRLIERVSQLLIRG
jgi:hypothetical protein